MMPRGRMQAIVLLAGSALVSMNACAPTARDRSRQIEAPIVVAVAAAPVGFDPRLALDDGSERISYLVYNRLLELDDTMRPSPGLAERYERVDPRTYRVFLRRNVRFHDGHILTARDVVYTITSIVEPESKSPRKGAYKVMTSVTALDDSTVEFRLAEPFEAFPMQLVVPIVPEGAGDELRTAPIGTGPYRFVRYAVDDHVELAPFRAYFGGPPRNAGIIVKIVPDDTMRGLELRKGSVDVVINDVPPDVVHAFRTEGRLHVETSPGTDYAYIGVNTQDRVLSDPRIRRALAHAVDREAIVQHLRRSLATVATGLLPASSWAYAPDVRTFPYDPARAARLLDDAGYRDPDGDGGAPRFALTLKISTNEFIRLQATVLQENFRAVGVDLDVRQYEFATLFADVIKGNFQLTTLQWVGGAMADPDILRRVFHSEQVPPAGFNRGRYRNPEVDRLLDEASRSTDTTERTRLYAEVQRQVADDQPYISLWHKVNVAVMQPGVSGLHLGVLADFRALKDVARTPDVKVSAGARDRY